MSTLGSINYACSVPILFSSYLLLASPVRGFQTHLKQTTLAHKANPVAALL